MSPRTHRCQWFQDLPRRYCGRSLLASLDDLARGRHHRNRDFFDENRDPVKLDQISQHMKDAHRFWLRTTSTSHGAVSAIGIGRAFLNNIS